jgi:site-specific recombinase XerD
LLGHTKIATTQIYTKGIKRKVSVDMQALKEKFNNQNNSPDLKLNAN